MSRSITADELNSALAAIASEIEYQETLPRRTDDEAKDVPGFATLARRYLRKMEDNWADNPGPVEACKDDMRKLAAIFVRGMIYNGIKPRQ